MLHVGADRSPPVVLVVRAAARPTGGAPGDVVLYRPGTPAQRVHLVAGEARRLSPMVELGATPLGATDGVVHGSGIDPFSGLSYTVLGNTSARVRAAKV